MAKIDKTYHQLLEKILTDGFKYEDSNRKGIYRYQIPHYQIKHDLQHSFPAITTKKLFWKGIVGELLWFLRGDVYIKYLIDNNINIWNKDAYNHLKKTSPFNESLEHFVKEVKNGELTGYVGRIYGAQWRKWQGEVYSLDSQGIYDEEIDQISTLIRGLKENPMGTRHIVTAWNPAELDDMALPPCHWSFEILVEPRECGHHVECCDIGCNGEDYQFTLKWHQRSVDTFLGLPFNIASYALLAHIIGKITNMIPKDIIGDLSNVHIYEPHLDAVKKQLSRSTNYHNSECNLEINKECKSILKDNNESIDDIINLLDIEDFKLTPHHECKPIKAEMIPYK